MKGRDLARVDSQGRAFAGSQRWIQYYVNSQPAKLSSSIAQALPGLRGRAGDIQWVSPLQTDGYQEYRDGDFLRRVGASEHGAALGRFWPARGPCWDALARLPNGSDAAVVLVEAKSYPAEMFSSGCMAGPASRARIEHALGLTKKWLGADQASDWLGPAYQYANRMAHLYFFREVVHVPAWLVNVYFIGDPRTPTAKPEWEAALLEISKTLGLANAGPPFWAAVYLEAKESHACIPPAPSPP